MSLLLPRNLDSLNVWDPFRGFPFEALPDPSPDSVTTEARIDWKETKESHVFKVDLPGLRKEDVKLEVEDGRVLQISGERRREESEDGKSGTWHCVERSAGKFVRRFRLPKGVKVDEMEAKMEDGVLTITVPKGELKKPRVTTVEISGGKGKNNGGKTKGGAVCCRFWP